MNPVPGVIVIVWNPITQRLLLLHRTLHWSGWEFVKGHVDGEETAEQAAQREVQEETGLSPVTLVPLHQELTFTADGTERRNKTFLATVESAYVTTGVEHDRSAWVTVDEALTLLTWKNTQELLLATKHLLTSQPL